MDKKPGKEFSEEAKPFIAEIREKAVEAYQHLLRIGHDIGQKFQKTFDHSPGLGMGGSKPRKSNKQEHQEDDQNN